MPTPLPLAKRKQPYAPVIALVLGTAAGLVVGLGFAYVASGAAENLVGNNWDGLASWTSGG